MNPFRIIALLLVMTTGLSSFSALADPNPLIFEKHRERPPAYAMAADLVVARPLLIGATILGGALFVVSLPFSALGGNVREAGEVLVASPAREAFVRCLGCVSSDEPGY